MKNRFNRLMIIFWVTFLFTSSDVLATPQYCSGTIANFFISRDGTLQIYGSWRNHYTKICNMNAVWNSVSPGVCKGWLSIVQAAILSGKKVTLSYPDGVISCAEIPVYDESPAPWYLMLIQ